MSLDGSGVGSTSTWGGGGKGAEGKLMMSKDVGRTKMPWKHMRERERRESYVGLELHK